MKVEIDNQKEELILLETVSIEDLITFIHEHKLEHYKISCRNTIQIIEKETINNPQIFPTPIYPQIPYYTKPTTGDPLSYEPSIIWMF